MEIKHVAQDPKDKDNIIVTWHMTKQEYTDLMSQAEEEIDNAEDENSNS